VSADAIVWTITIGLWAGIFALAGAWVIRRVYTWYHSHGRHPRPTEPPSTATAAPLWRLLRMVRRLVKRDRPVPHKGEPHTGATEKFRDELRALRDLPPAPELVSDVETDLRWAKIWHDYEHDLQTRIDAVFAPLLSALTGPLDAVTCMRLDAAARPTGEFNRAELDELLAVAA